MFNEFTSFPKIKNFTIQKRIGSGSYATVYKAYDKINQNICAIKCIKKQSLNSASRENLLREIEILKTIKHENVVQLIDFQWNEEYIYLIMEFCAADLSVFIRTKRTIPEKYARKFLQQIACALQYLHSRGIAHMDLKPQNILLTSLNNPILKLGDFGFAQYLRENNLSTSIRGSPLYMAPEILKSKIYDSKVDLWSVGVIFHEVLYGYAPFSSTSLEELRDKIMDDAPIKLPTHIPVSHMCQDLLLRLLERNPIRRISFEQFFAHPFIDLEHMPSSKCYKQAMDLLKQAVLADEYKDYLSAQQLYMQAIEYLLPAIQYETNLSRKQEMRKRANNYIERAEELTSLINPLIEIPIDLTKASVRSSNKKSSSASATSSIYRSDHDTKYKRPVSIPIARLPPESNVDPIADSIDHLSLDRQFQEPKRNSMPTTTQLLDEQIDTEDDPAPVLETNVYNENEEAKEAIRKCINADFQDTTSTSQCQEVLDQYHSAISILLPFLKTLPQDSEPSKLLRKRLDKWLTRAECLDERLKKEKRLNDLKSLQERNQEEEKYDNVSGHDASIIRLTDDSPNQMATADSTCILQ